MKLKNDEEILIYDMREKAGIIILFICNLSLMLNDPEILAVIENQTKQKEQSQHTTQEIAEGIEPTETTISEIQAEMIAAQAKEDMTQTNDNDQK